MYLRIGLNIQPIVDFPKSNISIDNGETDFRQEELEREINDQYRRIFISGYYSAFE